MFCRSLSIKVFAEFAGLTKRMFLCLPLTISGSVLTHKRIQRFVFGSEPKPPLDNKAIGQYMVQHMPPLQHDYERYPCNSVIHQLVVFLLLLFARFFDNLLQILFCTVKISSLRDRFE